MTRDELRERLQNLLWDKIDCDGTLDLDTTDAICALFDEATGWVPVTPQTMPPMEDDIVVLVVYSWGVRAHMAMDLTDEEIAAAGCYWCRLPTMPAVPAKGADVLPKCRLCDAPARNASSQLCESCDYRAEMEE
jgi:hypothetical protein